MGRTSAAMLLSAALVVLAAAAAHGASVAGPKACIDTPKKYKDALEGIIFAGAARGEAVCAGKLLGRTDMSWNAAAPNDKFSGHGLMWVFVSDGSVLNSILDFAREECKTKPRCSPTERQALAARIMNYAGVPNNALGTFPDTNYTMVVVDKAGADRSWKAGPFQPTWKQVYDYLNPVGFEVCQNGEADCPKKTLAPEFATTKDSIKKGYTEITGCKSGYHPLTTLGAKPSEICKTAGSGCNPLYCAYLATYENSFCPGVPASTECGSKMCVDLHKTSPKPSDWTLWTRAFFEVCMAMNGYFTGLGKGYDPNPSTNHPNGVVTGDEWLVRGDVKIGDYMDFEHVAIWDTWDP